MDERGERVRPSTSARGGRDGQREEGRKGGTTPKRTRETRERKRVREKEITRLGPQTLIP